MAAAHMCVADMCIKYEPMHIVDVFYPQIRSNSI